ncbi:MAG TPA: hypothetical protein VLX92_28980 [Kofleriaceae bacterium]|nr:hypothetical protein [Kofleriaceae bacterium]
MQRCTRCQVEFYPLRDNARRCPACTSRGRLPWIAGGATLVIAAGIVVATRIAAASESAAPAAAKPAAQSHEAAPSPAELDAIKACDSVKIDEVVKAYNRERLFAAAIRAGATYQTSCKRSPELDWAILYAHEALDHWLEASAISDRLVHETPTDADFWWWRGKDRGHLGQHERAVVDIRQSLAHADSSSNGVQIDPLEISANASNQPCETAFALRWLVSAGVELNDTAKSQYDGAYLGNKCAQLDGKGSLSWRDGIKHPKMAGELAGHHVVAIIDRGLGTTLVRREVAAAIGLGGGAEVDVMTPTGLGTGTIARANLAIGQASAPAVPVAVVDELPGGVDVVVGTSFLWRFELTANGDQLAAVEPSDD